MSTSLNKKLLTVITYVTITVAYCVVGGTYNVASASPVVLGKVNVQPAPNNAVCPNNRFLYGNNCSAGNPACMGAPNYTITWIQGANTKTTANSECWFGEPRYSFEPIGNPVADADGEQATIQIVMSDPAAIITKWFNDVTDGTSARCGPVTEGFFSTNLNSQTATIPIYDLGGDCRWNHVWFESIKDAQCVSHTIPSSFNPGETKSVSLTLNNVGSDIWTTGGPYELRSTNPVNNTTWGVSQAVVATDVSHGGNYTFTFNVTAPTTPGTYANQWQMYHTTSNAWFGAVCGASAVTVVAPTDTPTPTPTLTLTPTSTLTPSPTLTLTPSPTPIPGYCTQDASITLSAPPALDAGTITLKVKFQGAFLNNVTTNNNEQNVRVTIIKQVAEAGTGIGLQTVSSKTFSTVKVTNTGVADDKGIAIWQGSFTPTAITPGDNYSILVKGPYHLQRKFCENNPTEQAEEGLPYTCKKVGQIPLAETENSLDFSGVLLQAGDLPGSQGQDGVVNAHDVSLLLNILNNGTSTNPADLAVTDMDFNGIVNAKDRSNIVETLEEKYGDEEPL